MANTTNTQRTRNFENIKTVKTNVLNVARALQQTLAAVRQRANALSDDIQQRKIEYRQLEETSVNETVTQAEVENETVAAEQPVAVVEEVSEPKVVEPTPAPVAEEPPQQPKKPQTKVDTIIENGREIKRYTDEKGNVKIRKFLDTSSAKSSSTTSSGVKRDTRTGPNRTSGVKPNKDEQSSAGRSGQQRSAQNKKFSAVADVPRNEPQKSHGNKNKTKDHPDEKRQSNLKKLLTRDYTADYDEDKVVRRARTKKSESNTVVAPKITHAVVNDKEVPIKLLSERIGVSASEIIKQLFKEGIMKTINDTVDFDYAEYVAGLHGVTLELK